MRRYLFIDLHMHSEHSHEEGCVVTVEELLHNANELVDETRKLLINKVNATDNILLTDLVDKLVPYFADDEVNQKEIKENILSSKNIRSELIKNIRANTKCSISITDHQSIEGSREAMKLIASTPDKYSAINFIPGIEVNVGLRCIGTNEEGYSKFKKCHALAYNYDINDTTFNAYSNLYNFTIPQIYTETKRELVHREVIRKDRKTGIEKLVLKPMFETTITNENLDIHVGKMILFAKKKIADFTNAVIPMERLTYLTNLKTCEEVKNTFVKDMMKKYPNLTEEQLEIINSCFDFTPNGNDISVQGSKWELDEYMSAIKNAGGEFSIAHPYSIKRKMTEVQDKNIVNEFIDVLKNVTKEDAFELFKSLEIFDKESIRQNISAINIMTKKHYSADEIYSHYIDFTYSKNIQEFVEKVIDIRKDNDFGFEIFNKLSLVGAKGKVLYEIAKKYDLFLTGGSDHHGPSLHKENIMSGCFDSQFIYSDDNLFDEKDSNLQRKIDKTIKWSTDNYLTDMPYIEFLKNKDYKGNRQQISFYNRQQGTLSLSNNLFDRTHTWIIKDNMTAQKCRVVYEKKKFTHIPRKDFQYAGNKKSTNNNKAINTNYDNLENERINNLTNKFEQENIENERINNIGSVFENKVEKFEKQIKQDNLQNSKINNKIKPEIIEVADDDLTFEEDEYIM